MSLAVLASSAVAQLQFEEVSKRHLPLDNDGTRAVALGDVDGDGDLDLVLANAELGVNPDGEQNRLYLNDGTGAFTDATIGRLPSQLELTLAVALSDVDGDGDADLVFGTFNAQNRLYLNDGLGFFTDVTDSRMPIDSDATLAVAVGDVDGDDDPDLVFANAASRGGQPAGQPNRLYLNDGTGSFTVADLLPADDDLTVAVALGDVDGDGDADLIFANLNEQNRLYLNDGAARFLDATALRMPGDDDETRCVALGDVDRDGDADLVVGNVGGNRLYLNDGGGTFTDAGDAQMPTDGDFTRAVTWGDVDEDGDLDLLLGNSGTPSRVYCNDGTGGFTDATATLLPPHTEGTFSDDTYAHAVGDVDGDGDMDLVLGNILQNRLWLNDGVGVFRDATAGALPIDNHATAAVGIGDVDGDGDVDLVFGNEGFSLRQNRLYLNDGTGGFADVTASRMPPDSQDSRDVAVGDLDGDGDLDLVFANSPHVIRGHQNRLYVNDGAGTFADATDSRMPVDFDSTTSVALGDVDGDGDPDLVFGNRGPDGRQNRLYLNNGAGSFTDGTAGGLPSQDDNTFDVALGDVDGDGDLDLVFGNGEEEANRLLLNDGAGAFTEAAGLTSEGARTTAIALSDLDGDGDLDLVLGNRGTPGSPPQNRLYLNDGTGVFTDGTAARLPMDSDDTGAVACADVDGDGDLDLLFGSSGDVFFGGQRNRLYLNDGDASFIDVTARMPVRNEHTEDVAVGDLDGDGDLDVILGNWGRNRLQVNLLRQIGTPWLALPGREFRVDVHARHGVARASDLTLVYVSTGRATLELPSIGTVGIDLSRAAALPAFFVPQPQGVGSVAFTIPDLPALIGLRFYTQALLIPPLGPWSLTNVTADTIVR